MKSWSTCAFALVSLGVVVAACGSDPSEATFPLEASSELLSGFAFDTGLQPASSPVQLSLALKGGGSATASAVGLAVEGDDGPDLHQVGAGKIAIDGGITLDGRLVVDVPGVPGYDGDVPGLDDIRIAIVGEVPFEAFAIDSPATASAPIPAVDLPKIPLPGGVPGTLNLRVAEGSNLTVAVSGTCASIDGETATFRASAVRSGTLKLGAAVEIKVPVVGGKTFDIGTIEVPIPPADLALVAEHAIGEVGDALENSVVSPKACKGDDGTGGAGGTGAATGQTTSATQSATVTSTSTTQAVSASTTSGSVSCDASATCEACQLCLFDPGGDCESEANACAGNQACIDFLDCLNACPADDPGTAVDELARCACGDPDAGYTCDAPSAASCVGMHPAGVQDYLALGDCVAAQPCYASTCQ